MKMKVKGNGSTIVLIIILVLVIAIAVLFFITGGFGLGKGNGNGNGDEAVPANAEISAEASETSVASEETTVETQETQYIEITVSENKYIYQNNDNYSLEELVDMVVSVGMNDDETAKFDVALTNDNASLNAYNNLSAALKEKGFTVIDKSNE